MATLPRHALAWLLPLSIWLTGCGPPDPVPPLDVEALDPAVQRLLQERLELARETPGDARLHGLLALAYEANGLWDEAERSFANAARLNPSEPLWRYHRAIALRARGDYEESLALLEGVVEERPDSAAYQNRLGEALLEAGRVKAAYDPFERAAEFAPHRPEGFVGMAAVLLEQEDHEPAVALLEHALILDPSYRRTRYLLGRAYRGLGKLEEAEAQLALGLEAKTRHIPDELERERNRFMISVSARLERAIRLSEQGNTKRALRILQSLYDAHPDDVSIVNNLAATHMRTGDLRTAYELLTEARDLDPDRPTTWINMASCLTGMGTTGRALAHADEAVELAPELPGAHLARGRVLVAQRKHDEAYASLSRAVQLDPRNSEACQLLAETCVALERKAEALERYRTLVRLEPVALEAWLALGSLAVEQEDAKTAAEAWTVANRLAEDDPEVQRLREAWNALLE